MSITKFTILFQQISKTNCWMVHFDGNTDDFLKIQDPGHQVLRRLIGETLAKVSTYDH